MADARIRGSPRANGREEPAPADCHDDNPFIPYEDECQAFGPDEDPLGDFGLDDEETFPDERDFWIEPDQD